MEITVSQELIQVPVTVLQPHGALDASTYQDLIAKAQEVYDEGTRNLIIDLSETTYMSSSGIVALHSIALILQGQTADDPEDGWEAMHAIDRAREGGMQKHLKLLNPSPNVERVLDMVDFKRLVEVHTDLSEAVASFLT